MRVYVVLKFENYFFSDFLGVCDFGLWQRSSLRCFQHYLGCPVVRDFVAWPLVGSIPSALDFEICMVWLHCFSCVVEFGMAPRATELASRIVAARFVFFGLTSAAPSAIIEPFFLDLGGDAQKHF
jgi:hypothetical protein